MKALLLVLSLLLFGAELVAHAAPRLLVLNKEEATLVVIDANSFAQLGRVPTGFGPHELAVSTDGKLAFATNYGTAQQPGHTISMIDLGTLKEARRIDVAPLSRPHGAATFGGKLYFTVEGSRKIARYDPAQNRLDWEFTTGQEVTHMVLPSRNAKTLFTTNIVSNNVSVIKQGADGSYAQTLIAVGKGPEGLDLSPDGKLLWVAHSGDGGVSIVDTASAKVVRTLAIGIKRANRLKLTPDGKLVLISDLEGGKLIVLDAVQRKELRRLPLGRMPEGILIPPGGTRAYVAVNGDNHVAVIDLSSWQVIKKLATGNGPDGMAWVP